MRRMIQRCWPSSGLGVALFTSGMALSVSGCEAVLGSSLPQDAQEEQARRRAQQVGEATRFRRLTHHQWENTVRDLLRLNDRPGLSDGFRSDPTQSGYLFEGNGDALEVDPALWAAYQRAAAELSERVVSDDEALARLMPADADSASHEKRARAFIEHFGRRAHRRPLSEQQIDDYLAVYRTGTTSYDDQPGFEGGIRLVIESMLQSPYFLYLVEDSERVERGVVPLSGDERATRLSYFFWGTMPDDELFEAAADGTLDSPDGVRFAAERLIEDEQAKDVIVRFFDHVLEVERYEAISPSSDVYPGAGGKLPESALKETRLFVEKQMYDQAGTLRDLLLSTTTYVDDELASIYGLGGQFGDEFEEVSLDPDERSGVLTQVGFLASHATSRDPDPIHRGVFLAKRMSCLTKSAPPDNVPPLPDPEGKSNRELVEAHTEAEGTSCRNCHTTWINPFGFPYENYDAVGAYRTMDGPHPVDASGSPPIDGEPTDVADAIELAEVLANSEQYHECLSGYLVSFALGRPDEDRDEALIEELSALSKQEAVPFRDLMVEMSVAISFLNRSAEDGEKAAKGSVQ